MLLGKFSKQQFYIVIFFDEYVVFRCCSVEPRLQQHSLMKEIQAKLIHATDWRGSLGSNTRMTNTHKQTLKPTRMHSHSLEHTRT